MDWFSTIIGAAIGFISSIGIIVAERLLDKKGKLRIFAKVVYDHFSGLHSWGFRNTSDGMFLNVPLWLEFQNTSNAVRVIRDANLVLFDGNERVAETIQMNRCGDKEDAFMYANNGSYSFVIQPRSIVKYECHFALKKNSQTQQCFTRICLRYFDERNKEKSLILGDVDGSWQPGDFPRSGKWIELASR